MSKKTLPYNKTVVIRSVVELADALKRQTLINASSAIKIPVGDNFNYEDMSIEQETVFSVKNGIVLSSFDDFIVTVFKEDVGVELICHGQFIHSGSCEKLSVTPVNRVARIKYVVS